jgi:hypothetical protein
MRFLPAMLLAVAVLVAPVVWYFTGSLFERQSVPGGPAVDSEARIELEELRGQVEIMEERLKLLESRLDNARAGTAALPDSGAPRDAIGIPEDTENLIIDSYAQVVLIGSRRNLNRDLTVATPSFLVDLLGRPRQDLGDDCEPMTNPTLSSMLVLEQVGPIKVRMLQPAIDSLKRVFENVRNTDPDLYARIDQAGSLCVRRIRGSTNSVSTHAFGLAVDLNIDGHLDTLGDGKTQLGLTILQDFFREEGWIWGAAFTREDSMHFEVSREMLERWRGEGII